ncbi:unnamed protein product [Miscanthus lutarioriparius]|uniref:Uncharacterized protein n=1 Tax=Miscanthus lutarioriparius TaxID=422564 RepID=A0A811P5D3_9POAL|nr:unnamed protein product [Miscanthus lutarioriparius]
MVLITDAVIARYTSKLADLIEDRVMRALGVSQHLQVLKGRLDYMKSVLVDAEVKRIHDSAINTWLNKLKDIIIKDINERLERILKERVMLWSDRIIPEHTSVPNVDIRLILLPDVVVGADIVNSTNEMVEKLIAFRDVDSKFCVFGIEGMPGIGKTTLAKKIYNDPRIEEFQLRIWLCITETFAEINFLKQMIREAGGSAEQQTTERNFSQIHKDAISYWWAAEGLVSHDDLVRRSLLQLHPSYLDKSRSTTHDLLRSLSQYLSKDESMFIDARTITDSVSMLRHVGIANVGERLPAALKKIVRLRTLALFISPNFSIINGELFRRLKHLHILILSETSIRAVPKSIKNSVHLRVLDEFGASEGSGSQLHKTPGNPKVNRATSKSSLSFIAGLQKMQMNPQQILLMPHLKRLMLINCPKLQALRRGCKSACSGLAQGQEQQKFERALQSEEFGEIACPRLSCTRNSEATESFLGRLSYGGRHKGMLYHNIWGLHSSTTGGDDRDMFPNESIYN